MWRRRGRRGSVIRVHCGSRSKAAKGPAGPLRVGGGAGARSICSCLTAIDLSKTECRRVRFREPGGSGFAGVAQLKGRPDRVWLLGSSVWDLGCCCSEGADGSDSLTWYSSAVRISTHTICTTSISSGPVYHGLCRPTVRVLRRAEALWVRSVVAGGQCFGREKKKLGTHARVGPATGMLL